MSIATQTPEGKNAYSPQEDRLFDHADATEIERTSLANIIAFPERSESESSERIERVGPEYTFENLLAVREEVTELDQRIADLRQELVSFSERAEVSKEQMDDIGMFTETAVQPEQIKAHLARVQSRQQTLMADIAMLLQEIKAKENARAKFLEWQKEVELDLEKKGNREYFALKEAETVHPYRLGALDRIEGIIADRTPH